MTLSGYYCHYHKQLCIASHYSDHVAKIFTVYSFFFLQFRNVSLYIYIFMADIEWWLSSVRHRTADNELNLLLCTQIMYFNFFKRCMESRLTLQNTDVCNFLNATINITSSHSILPLLWVCTIYLLTWWTFFLAFWTSGLHFHCRCSHINGKAAINTRCSNGICRVFHKRTHTQLRCGIIQRSTNFLTQTAANTLVTVQTLSMMFLSQHVISDYLNSSRKS